MFIQYINKLPSKIEFFDILRISETNKYDINQLDKELNETITAVCAYRGDRIVGIGRIKKEKEYLYIQDVIVLLEECKEEIENSIITNLVKQVNQLKNYDVEVRDCLQMPKNENEFYKKYNFLISDFEVVGA